MVPQPVSSQGPPILQQESLTAAFNTAFYETVKIIPIPPTKFAPSTTPLPRGFLPLRISDTVCVFVHSSAKPGAPFFKQMLSLLIAKIEASASIVNKQNAEALIQELRIMLTIDVPRLESSVTSSVAMATSATNGWVLDDDETASTTPTGSIDYESTSTHGAIIPLTKVQVQKLTANPPPHGQAGLTPHMASHSAFTSFASLEEALEELKAKFTINLGKVTIQEAHPFLEADNLYSKMFLRCFYGDKSDCAPLFRAALAFREIVRFDVGSYLAQSGNSITMCVQQLKHAMNNLPSALRADNGDLHESIVILLLLLRIDNRTVFTD